MGLNNPKPSWMSTSASKSTCGKETLRAKENNSSDGLDQRLMDSGRACGDRINSLGPCSTQGRGGGAEGAYTREERWVYVTRAHGISESRCSLSLLEWVHRARCR